MDQLISLLEKSYTSSDNQDLKELLDIFLSFCYDQNFYQTLLIIFQDEEIDSKIKFAGLICLKNIIRQRWMNLPDSIHQIIINMFTEVIIHLQDPSFISHIMEISDLLTDKNLLKIEWTDIIYQNIENDPISSLILTYSLIYQHEKKDASDILTNMLSFIFTQLQEGEFNPLFLKISLKIIRYSFNIVQFEDHQLIFLIQFMIDNFSQDYINQYIKIFSKISTIKPLLIYEIENSLISNLTEFLNDPKVAIHFFHMIGNFSKDEKLWEMFDNNFIELFIPFFSFDESEMENPVQFINDHFFDSFSSNSDPNSAAFRCLEIISQKNESSIIYILENLKSEFENPTNKIYSISHLTSAVLKNLFLANLNELAIELFNFVFPFLQTDSVLIKCGVLIILQFEYYLELPIEEHIKKCLEMIFDPNELIQYFSMNVLLKNLPHFESISILEDFPPDSVVSKILQVSQEFEIPQMTDLLHYLFKNQSYLSQVIPHLVEIVNSTFSFAQFYSEMDITSCDISISSVFNSILTIIVNLTDFSPLVEFEICKLSFIRSSQIINSSLIMPVLEMIFTSLFYSPNPFEEMWSSFEFLMPFLDEMTPLSNELIFSSLAIIISRDQEGLENRLELVSNAATVAVNHYEVNDFSIFIAALIKLNAFQEDMIPTLICKFLMAWQNDGIDFSDGVFQLLTVIFQSYTQIFIEIFNENLAEFFNDLIESCETKLNLMMIFPFICQFLDEDQKSNCVSFIDSEDQAEEEEIENRLSLPHFSLFLESEIIENYHKFIC